MEGGEKRLGGETCIRSAMNIALDETQRPYAYTTSVYLQEVGEF